MKKVGTLAAAASLAATCEGYAHIVKVPINETLPAGGHYSYDINSDGIDDITFNSSLITDIYMESQELSLPSGTFTAGVVVDLDGEYLRAFQPCDSVPLIPNSETHSSGLFPSSFSDQSPPLYAGFRFCSVQDDTIITAYHYAWVQANVHSASGDLEILAFGYETESNKPITIECTTGVTENVPSPPFALLQNSPNPFSTNTKIDFELPASAAAAIRIYDVSGRLVRKFDRAVANKGINSVLWDGRDERGRNVSSGIYFCNLEALGAMQSLRMVIIR